MIAVHFQITSYYFDLIIVYFSITSDYLDNFILYWDSHLFSNELIYHVIVIYFQTTFGLLHSNLFSNNFILY